ncbi:MAG TPA: phosphoribosylanthranilate isomerase [Firmicutes bacterium]|nr:phosphoribosylanthranilate isomerase [Bacillota bacterium]
MTAKVMVCGSKDQRDIELLVGEGVDGIGLITEVSQDIPCNLRREEARRLCALIPPLVEGILIVTEDRRDELFRLVEAVRPQVVQLHGFQSPGLLAALKEEMSVKVVKAVHLSADASAPDSPQLVRAYLEAGADAILLDSICQGKVGATGRTLDWHAARRVREAIWPRPLILAGGLHAGNVKEAVRTVQPFAVDVLSGVSRDDRLDPGRVREFIEAVRGRESEDRA